MNSAAANADYPATVEYLYRLRWFGAKFGLENSFRLAELAGNPQQRLRFIHVAGTNGKGSTCAMLESIYRAAGLRVGLFTSPHLVSFRERLQVDRRLIGEADVVRLVNELRPWLKQLPHEQHPTFFEVVTILALRYFVEQRCELVIWETGLGGRLDATNIVTPLASVITNINIEHSEWLGDTVEKIASEKAGIIKPGVRVLTGARPGEGLEVIAAAAREKKAPLTVVDPARFPEVLLDKIELPLHGPHQHSNAAIAMATVNSLAERIPVSEAAVKQGLATVYWPGRMQRVQRPSGQIILLDGAHNPAGAEALRAALEAERSALQPALIFGVFRDKDSVSMCRSLAPLAHRIVLTPVHNERSEDPANLASACRAASPGAAVEICASLAEALEKTAGEKLVVIAGSLYLIGEAMELLQLTATPPTDEKKLNDWSGKR